jgi:catechol 2,3-dioxygenase-like lactoylglutathione lyase family enzyme
VNSRTLKRQKKETVMEIKFANIIVDSQDKALEFYTTKLGFTKVSDIPMGPFRWLTVSSPEGVAGAELFLEPAHFPPAKVYQKARFDAGIPILAMISKDIQAEYKRLKSVGVLFRDEPKNMGPIISAVFEDTCGNLIHLIQPIAA